MTRRSIYNLPAEDYGGMQTTDNNSMASALLLHPLLRDGSIPHYSRGQTSRWKVIQSKQMEGIVIKYFSFSSHSILVM